ncbi:hypothetical protein [Xanthomonas arboricola]|uniref:hypothetical protein n=1 Tax=Xanthomonas arboricola TaxID=56448 RepID=UPI0023BA3646|nr:hypothetical protein [Xanthomonas arboricola]
MIGSILQFSDLQEVCRPGEKPRLATVEAWARCQGIRYQYDSRGGIWTTIDALNHALGLAKTVDQADHYNAENLI